MSPVGHTWAKDREWDGFQPVEYSLDFQKIFGLQLAEVRRANGADEEVATSIGEAFQKFATGQVESVESGLDMTAGKIQHAATIKTAAGDVKFRGMSFNCDVLAVLLSFRKEGINPFETAWFFYDQDSVTDDPHEMYGFFVVHADRIIRERVAFNDHSSSGFDPTILRVDDSPAIWSSDGAWKDARVRFLYRKFYMETPTGQLMVLRSDEPELYHYPEGRRTAAIYAASDSAPGDTSGVAFPEMAGVQRRLDRICFVLWVVAVLAIIQFLSRWL